jgi:hypothetical protein
MADKSKMMKWKLEEENNISGAMDKEVLFC